MITLAELEKICAEDGICIPPYELEMLVEGIVARDKGAGGKLIAHYCNEWKARYGTMPIIDGKAAGTAKRLVKDLGLSTACEMISVYLRMHDHLYLARRHDLLTFSMNLNAVKLYADRGVTVTNKELHDKDRLAAERAGWERLRDGKK